MVRADGGDAVARDCERVIDRPGRFDKQAPGEIDPQPRDLSGFGRGGERRNVSGEGATTGSSLGDTLDGLSGAQRIDGGPGRDMLSGGTHGTDVRPGGFDVTTLLEEPGAEALVGGHDEDLLVGGPGDDVLVGDEIRRPVPPQTTSSRAASAETRCSGRAATSACAATTS